jgi:hypothetical protein
MAQIQALAITVMAAMVGHVEEQESASALEASATE